MSLLSVEGVCKSFAGPAGERRAALTDVSLSIGAGERVAILGESGAGKSTLAMVSLGLMPFDAGKVTLFDQQPSRWDKNAAHQARSRAQFLPQDPQLMLNPYLPLSAVLSESAQRHQAGADPKQVMQQALEDVGLGDRAAALPHELSGGEQRRASLARVLIAAPELLFLDEPTIGLDAPRKLALVELLTATLDPSCAVVLITHDIGLAHVMCDRFLIMQRGHIVEELSGPLSGCAPAHPFTQSLLEAYGLRPGGA